MSKPWLKLWIEWIHDPKLFNLTLAEKGAWAELLTLAQECDADGHLVMGDGSPMTLEDISKSLHLTKKREISELASMITKMTKVGSISKNSKAIFITNFYRRQNLAPSDTKEAIKERVQRYREKHKATDSSSPPTPPSLSKDKEIYIDTECNGVTPVTIPMPLVSNVTKNLVSSVPSSDQKLSKNVKTATKKPYGEFNNVLLTDIEFEKLGIKFGKQKAAEMIERMSAGVASKGYKYKSHYAAILNWDNMDKKRLTEDSFARKGVYSGKASSEYSPQPKEAGAPGRIIDGDAEPQY